jgi:hypothetical protein
MNREELMNTERALDERNKECNHLHARIEANNKVEENLREELQEKNEELNTFIALNHA